MTNSDSTQFLDSLHQKGVLAEQRMTLLMNPSKPRSDAEWTKLIRKADQAMTNYIDVLLKAVEMTWIDSTTTIQPD